MPTKPRNRKGLPKALQAIEDNEIPEQTPEEFAQEFFGTADKPQDGMPSIDWLKQQFETRSATIRYLINQGFEVKRIAKHLGILLKFFLAQKP